jgi:uncharacterized membrane protein YhaH (DUF805 family)
MNLVTLFCSTQGRVGRGLYWACFGIWLLVDLLLRGSVSVVAAFTGDERVVAIAFWAWVGFGVVTYFPLTALLVKRLHDTGRSGAWTVFQHLTLFSLLMLVASVARMAVGSLLLWSLLILLCAIGSLVVFVFTLVPGDDGSNSYGMAG